MPRKEVYCENCGSNQPMVEQEPHQDELNPYPWYDITCGTCHSIIATIQIVPNDKPLESSKAVETEAPPSDLELDLDQCPIDSGKAPRYSSERKGV
jgi:hypothetical protein